MGYIYDHRAHCDSVLELVWQLQHVGISTELDLFHSGELQYCLVWLSLIG